jgi:hypothetical protein
MHKQIASCLLLLCSVFITYAHAATLATPEQLRADLRFIQEQIAATHPEPGFSADPVKLRQTFAQIDAQITVPLTQDQAWRLLATLNPIFADAHLALTPPDPHGQSAAFLQSGGRLFPFEVEVDPAGIVTIRGELGGAPSALTGVRIEKINGIPAARIVAELLARCHGDTLAFRAGLLSKRWPFLYWKMYGNVARYDLALSNGKRIAAPGLRRMPQYLDGENDFDRQFRFDMLGRDAALLTINTFAWPDKKQFTDFTEQAFARMREAKVKTLLIDVRANGGGNDDLWMDGILRYIADKPYRWASTYRKKVIKGRDSATEKLGDVIDGAINKWAPPEPDNPHHFSGTTYVLVGRDTYSSSILFGNVMQDFGFGKLAGASGRARVRQSGGTQGFILPNSGLTLGVPRLIFQRPSGAVDPVLLQPDVLLPDNPWDRQALIEAVMKQ